MLRMLVITMVLALAGAAQAQTDPYQFVGFSTATVQGDAGVFGMTAQCQATFDATARMCTSVEVMETVVLPSSLPPNTSGWVRPVFVPTGSGSGFVIDAGGEQSSDLSCRGWSTSYSGNSGLVVDDDGRISTQNYSSHCNQARPVACCKPVPLPEPSALLLNGTGLAALWLLSTGQRDS